MRSDAPELWLDRVGKTDFAWPTLLVAVGAVGGFVALGIASAMGVIPFAVAIPIQGFLAFASFTPMHDATHKAIAPKSRWIDEVVGWICGLPVLAAFAGLKYLHLAHHKHTNDPALDPDSWSSKAKSRPGIVLRWLVLDLHYLARYVTEAKTRPRRELVASGILVALMLGSWAIFVATGHGLELLLCWLVPSRIAIVMLSVFFDWIPHSPRRVTVGENPYRASNVYEHRWLTPLLLSQNYHLIHHLFPGVPFYRYGAVYWQVKDELVKRGADLRRIGSRVETSEPSKLRVARVLDETHDTKTFVFESGYPYVPGQFVVVHVPTAGALLKRCYSISNDFEITVKRQGVASTWLHENVVAGTELRVDPPAGRFVLCETQRPCVFFAAGSGITPIIAMIESAIGRRKIKLVYANRDRASTIFRERLAALDIEVVFHEDDQRGRIDEETVAAHIEADAEVYSCGPEGFLDTVERATDRIGVPRERRFTEHFVRRAPATNTPLATCFVGIRRGRSIEIEVRGDETILQAGRRAGLTLRASCEAGYCGTCAATVTSGHVASACGPLSDGELARGFVLPCSARALGPAPVVVNFDASPLGDS